MRTLWHDVRQGLRVLLKTPGFTAVAIVTLALGIGANTAIFSVVNAVLLAPLPYPQADRLVRVSEQVRAMRMGGGRRGGPRSFVTGDTFKGWRDSTQTLEGIAAYSPRAYTLTGLGEPIRLRGTAVSASMFPMLRVSPERGRLFDAGDEHPGADQVAILSDALWTRRFDRDPGIVGRTLTLDDRQYTVIGVLPASFYFPDRESEMWTPFVLNLPPQRSGERMILAFQAIARVKDGVSLAQAEAEGTTVAQRSQPPPPPRMNAGDLPPAGMKLVPLQEEMVAGVRAPLLVLLGAVGFVLLIACANIANLLLARGASRQRELAVRTALGARRGRLLRQLLTESLVLGIAGGALGVLLAWWLQRALPAISPGNIPRIDQLALDARVLAFAFGLSVATGLLFGLAPALQGSRVNVLRTLNEAGMRRTGGFRFLKGNRLRSLLVVAEVALALVLLVGAGLLVKSFVTLTDVNPGYEPDNALTAQISLPNTKYGDPGVQRAFFDQLIDRLDAVPGVKAAGTTNMLPLLPGNIVLTFGIAGQPQPSDPEDMPRASLRVVSQGYAEAMGLHLVEGRTLTAADAVGTPTVVMVNEALARQYFSDHALGQRIQMFGPDPIRDRGRRGRRAPQRPRLGAAAGDVHLLQADAGRRALRDGRDVSRRALGRRPAGARARGAAGRARPRPEPPSRQRHDDGAAPVGVSGRAALLRAAPRPLRRPRAPARHGRHLRRALLQRLAAHSRDRRAHGARRRASRHPAPRRPPGPAADPHRRGDRPRRRVRRDALPRHAALRRDDDRPGDLRGPERPARRRGVPGVLDPGPAGDARRSDDGVEVRVGATRWVAPGGPAEAGPHVPGCT